MPPKRIFAPGPWSSLRRYKKYSEYIEFLSSYSIPEQERLDGIKKAFSGNTGEYVVNLLLLLCEKKHIEDFFDCVAEYEALLKFSENVCTAKIVSAIPLDDADKKKICDKLASVTGKRIVPRYSVDESLIGGVTVEADGRIFDGSLKSRLKEIKEVISK